MTQLENIIYQCKHKNAEAQRVLYEMYKDRLFAICLRYCKIPADAEDTFIEGFYKIYNKIDQYNGEGSFEGWMRRIMVNESLQFIRKKTNLHLTLDIKENDIADSDDGNEWSGDFDFDQIMAAVYELPTGYRTVFNMYVFEEYKHREIAEILGISIHTSKSQYLLAKKKLIEIIQNKQLLDTRFTSKS